MDQALAAAKAEAEARPLGTDERKYSPGLDTWINRRGWEAPAEKVGDLAGPSLQERAERQAEQRRAELDRIERERQAESAAADPDHEQRFTKLARRLGVRTGAELAEQQARERAETPGELLGGAG